MKVYSIREDERLISRLREELYAKNDSEVFHMALRFMDRLKTKDASPPVGIQRSSNPYKDWTIVTNPDGEQAPYFSDYHDASIIVLRSPKGTEKVITDSDPLYNEFV